MDRWQVEPYWQWWEAQMAMMAPEPAPDPELQQVARDLVRELTGRTRRTDLQELSWVRRGGKPWKRRR